MIAASVVLLLGGVIVIWYIAAYNGLVSARNRAEQGWADVKVEFFDLPDEQLTSPPKVSFQ